MNFTKNLLPKLGVALLLSSLFLPSSAKEWTLDECVAYALQNNVTLQKLQLQRQSAHESTLQSKSELLPSLSASTTQSLGFTPWVTTGVSSDGYSRAAVNKTYYNGSYGINANWTVWNGNRNYNTVKLNQLAEQRAELDSTTQARNIQEQIVQLYVQILYATEAVKVNEESYKTSRQNEERGKEMVAVGKMSKADLAQLTAQTAQSQLAVVTAQTQVSNYKRQLKEVLQLTNEDFDVAVPATTDDMALQTVPGMQEVYAAALNNRPEIKAYQNAIDQQDLNIKIAKAGKLPTVSLNAGVNTSTTTMNSYNWSKQLKYNFMMGAGVTVSIPLFDNRATKTAVNKAQLSKLSATLDLKQEHTGLYSTIENYWLQAENNQAQFKAARVSSQSAQESYDLLNEQFKLGLKNIVELMTGKDNLLKAKQDELQAKYLTILNIDLLNFYKTGVMK